MLRQLLGLGIVMTLGCAQKPVKVEEPSPERSWVEQVARDHNHEVLKCYEDRLRANSKIRGDLTLSLDGKAGGDVTAARVIKSVDNELDNCVIKKAQSWKFPWLNHDTVGIEDAYHLYLNKEGQPMAEYESPNDSHEGVRQVVHEHMSEVRHCYEPRLAADPELSGKLVLDWTLGEKGEVTSVKTHQEFDYVVDNCVMNRLKTWKFVAPAKDKKVTVTYPFFFAPR